MPTIGGEDGAGYRCNNESFPITYVPPLLYDEGDMELVMESEDV